jgi:hypothetical protein
MGLSRAVSGTRGEFMSTEVSFAGWNVGFDVKSLQETLSNALSATNTGLHQKNIAPGMLKDLTAQRNQLKASIETVRNSVRLDTQAMTNTPAFRSLVTARIKELRGKSTPQEIKEAATPELQLARSLQHKSAWKLNEAAGILGVDTNLNAAGLFEHTAGRDKLVAERILQNLSKRPAFAKYFKGTVGKFVEAGARGSYFYDELSRATFAENANLAIAGAGGKGTWMRGTIAMSQVTGVEYKNRGRFLVHNAGASQTAFTPEAARAESLIRRIEGAASYTGTSKVRLAEKKLVQDAIGSGFLQNQDMVERLVGFDRGRGNKSVSKLFGLAGFKGGKLNKAIDVGPRVTKMTHNFEETIAHVDKMGIEGLASISNPLERAVAAANNTIDNLMGTFARGMYEATGLTPDREAMGMADRFMGAMKPLEAFEGNLLSELRKSIKLTSEELALVGDIPKLISTNIMRETMFAVLSDKGTAIGGITSMLKNPGRFQAELGKIRKADYAMMGDETLKVGMSPILTDILAALPGAKAGATKEQIARHAQLKSAFQRFNWGYGSTNDRLYLAGSANLPTHTTEVRNAFTHTFPNQTLDVLDTKSEYAHLHPEVGFAPAEAENIQRQYVERMRTAMMGGALGASEQEAGLAELANAIRGMGEKERASLGRTPALTRFVDEISSFQGTSKEGFETFWRDRGPIDIPEADINWLAGRATQITGVKQGTGQLIKDIYKAQSTSLDLRLPGLAGGSYDMSINPFPVPGDFGREEAVLKGGNIDRRMLGQAYGSLAGSETFDTSLIKAGRGAGLSGYGATAIARATSEYISTPAGSAHIAMSLVAEGNEGVLAHAEEVVVSEKALMKAKAAQRVEAGLQASAKAKALRQFDEADIVNERLSRLRGKWHNNPQWMVETRAGRSWNRRLTASNSGYVNRLKDELLPGILEGMDANPTEEMAALKAAHATNLQAFSEDVASVLIGEKGRVGSLLPAKGKLTVRAVEDNIASVRAGMESRYGGVAEALSTFDDASKNLIRETVLKGLGDIAPVQVSGSLFGVAGRGNVSAQFMRLPGVGLLKNDEILEDARMLMGKGPSGESVTRLVGRGANGWEEATAAVMGDRQFGYTPGGAQFLRGVQSAEGLTEARPLAEMGPQMRNLERQASKFYKEVNVPSAMSTLGEAASTVGPEAIAATGSAMRSIGSAVKALPSYWKVLAAGVAAAGAITMMRRNRPLLPDEQMAYGGFPGVQSNPMNAASMPPVRNYLAPPPTQGMRATVSGMAGSNMNIESMQSLVGSMGFANVNYNDNSSSITPSDIDRMISARL